MLKTEISKKNVCFVLNLEFGALEFVSDFEIRASDFILQFRKMDFLRSRQT